ncbi:MAG TPA: hypothetical protein DD730_12350, partial [Desulfosporosinus sp.]|nr:hypothetical protein [Desulfosporosinus sp.]
MCLGFRRKGLDRATQVGWCQLHRVGKKPRGKFLIGIVTGFSFGFFIMKEGKKMNQILGKKKIT